MKRSISIFILLIFLGLTTAIAQNISTTNVQNLSDSQIAAIVQKVQSSGLTMDQAIALAKAKGATQTQIDQLMSRISQLQGKTQPGVQTPSKGLNTTTTKTNYSQKASFKASPIIKKTFGYNLFNNKNLTFNPAVNIPTPKNYVLGAGDELMINIWGASQQTYQLPIDKSGNIYIPSLGPVYVAGMNFDTAAKKIKKRLTEIYSGLAKKQPDTWAMVTLSSLRSVRINMVGAVNVPGTYYLPATATVFNALYLSGGPNKNGSFRNIKLIRNNKTIQTIDVYDFLMNGQTKGNIQLRDQDVIFIPVYQVRVETKGQFKRNNYFNLKKGESLSDLLRYAGGFSDSAYRSMVTVNRITEKEKEILDIYKSKFSAFTLHNGDVIKADTVLNRYKNRITIKGAVYRPGNYQLLPGMTLSELISKAEGVRENVFVNRGIIIREKENLTKITIPFDVKKVVSGLTNIPLKREDQIIINSIETMRQSRNVKISGEVQKTGTYPYYENMTVGDLIFLANGFKPGATGLEVEVARRNDSLEASKPNSHIAHVYTLKVDKNLKLNETGSNFKLKPYDNVFVRKAPGYVAQRNVTVRGEVVYPGKYTIQSKNERISDLLKRVGGLTRFAFAPGATLKRYKKGNSSQQERLKEITMSSDSTFKLDSLQQAQINKNYTMVELNLPKILSHPGSNADYVLKQDDEINIPEVKQTVTVTGAVMNPITLSYQSGKTAGYYINKAGGYSNNAKRSKVYIVYANGTTSVGKENIQPGSQIIVPLRPKSKGNFMNEFTKIFAIITSVLTTVVLVKRL